MKILWIEETGSTNTYVKERLTGLEFPTMVIARRQTAGRGQRGNTWESEPGRNLTFSICLRPEVREPEGGVKPLKASAQFDISEAVALGMADTLTEYGITAKVKWPNDIYVGDMKIAGILIENSVMGCEITSSIAGIGLNVNQRRFLSDAPNPVSMSILTEKTFDLERVAAVTAEKIEKCLHCIGFTSLHEEYKSRLWRGDGVLYPFRDSATGEEFMAKIEDVERSGTLVLRDKNGRRREYSFKEVAFLH